MQVKHTVAVSEAEIIRAVEKHVRSHTPGSNAFELHVTINWRQRKATVEAVPLIPTLTEKVNPEEVRP